MTIVPYSSRYSNPCLTPMIRHYYLSESRERYVPKDWIFSNTTVRTSYLLCSCCVLMCSVVFCCVLLCSVVFCSVLFCSVLFCSVLFCSVLFCSVLFFSQLHKCKPPSLFITPVTFIVHICTNSWRCQPARRITPSLLRFSYHHEIFKFLQQSCFIRRLSVCLSLTVCKGKWHLPLTSFKLNVVPMFYQLTTRHKKNTSAITAHDKK